MTSTMETATRSPRKPEHSRPRGRDHSFGGSLGVFAILGLAAFYFIAPIWWLIVAATKPAGRQFTEPSLWFSGFGLVDNVGMVVTEHGGIFGRWMLNSVVYSGVSAALGTLISVAAGYALAKYAFPGRDVIFAVILGAVLVPKVLFTLPLFLLFSQVGLLNNPLAFLLPSIVSPFGVYLGRVFAAQAVPDELIEAGRIDGASEVRIFFSIALRIMSPAIVTIFLFSFVEVWNNYLLPVMVLNDTALQPVTVGLVGWANSNGQVPAGTVVVAALLSVIPLILAFLCLQRFWRAGLTAGAVK